MWSCGVLKGQTSFCPHKVFQPCVQKPEASQQPSNPDFPHLTHTVTMAVTETQVESMIVDPYKYLSPKRRALRALRMHCLNPFFSDTFIDSVWWMWTRCRTGIAVCIRQNQLALFVPFCNANYCNTWSPEACSNVPHQGLPSNRWWANGWTLCGDKVSDQLWTDRGVCALQHMILSACARGIVSDCDFIINKRDSACVRKDCSDALNPFDEYSSAFGTVPRLVPILSLYSGATFHDVAMPLPDDWQRVVGKYFLAQKPESLRVKPKQIAWDDKKPCAIFRGGLTGSGGNRCTNQRIALVSLPPHPTLDIKTTSFAGRLRFCPIEKRVVQPQIEPHVCVHKNNFMPLHEQQEKFKFSLLLDGHSAADRTASLFQGHQVVLKVNSPQHCLCPDSWANERLHAWQHYVPVKSNFSDLLESVSWALDNPQACHDMLFHCKKWSENEKEMMLQWWTDITAAMSHLPFA